MYWLRRIADEINSGQISDQGRKYIALAVIPRWRMNWPEYRKAIRLRRLLFGTRRKTALPAWVLAEYETGQLDRRIAERLRGKLRPPLIR